MDSRTDSARPARRLIDGNVKALFLAGLRANLSREAAAAEAGFPLKSLYGAGRRDPVFRLGWTWALELSAGDEQAARKSDLELGAPAQRLENRGSGKRCDAAALCDEDVPVRIAPQGCRPLQRRRMRWVRFTEKRQQIFLDHFAATADAHASAEAAGVSYATVRAHYRKHPEFAALWHEALREAVAGLEAEAVRERLEMQRRLKENLEPKGEMAAEFERVMKLLARWDRRDGSAGPRSVSHGRQRRWTFEEAMTALDKKLRSLGLRHGIPGDKP